MPPGNLDPASIHLDRVFGPAQAAIDLRQQQRHLEVLGPHLDRLFVELRGLFEVSFGEARPGVEIVGIEQPRVEPDRGLELLLTPRIAG